MQSLNELTQILYEIAMDVGNGLDLQPMLKKSVQTLLRKLSGFGAVVLADRHDRTRSRVERVFVLPGNLERNPAISAEIDRLCSGGVSELGRTDWSGPKALPCGKVWLYRLDLPNYGMLLFFKSCPLDPIVARSLRKICGKLADSCIACENSEALAQSQERLQVTFDSIGDAVIVTNRQGAVTLMNPVAEELTGWTLGTALERPLCDVFHIVNYYTRDRVENPVDKVLETGRIVGLANHTVLIAKGGEERQISDSGAPIHDHRGQIIGVVLVFRDVTEEYELQEKLNHSQKMDAIGQLAGGVAHDFNNMLGGIIGAAEVLKPHLQENPTAQKFQQIILEAANRAAGLTQQLLTFASKRPLVFEVIDLQSLVDSTVLLLKRTIDPRVDIDISFPAEQVFVSGDPSQLQNAILNLGINAWHAMPDGGTLSISARTIEVDETFCEKNRVNISAGWYAEIQVRDSGGGIAAEHISRVFEPFFTTKEQGRGTGLGLAAVFGTVKQHHGNISVQSEIDKGTCFYILLPLASAERPVDAEGMDEITGAGTLLVVDDESVMRATAKAVLEALGYDVLLAENGKEAIRIFKKKKTVIDMVILDMAMPLMDGRDCFMALREIDSSAKIVLASGYVKNAVLAELRESGLSGFIRKPFNKVELSQIVHRIIDLPPS